MTTRGTRTGQPPTPLVSVSGLDKRYPGVLALDHAHWSIGAGQVMGLVGKNGAGKSTLIKVLAGATHPDEGEIRLGGERVEIHTPHQATEMGLAFVHQELADVPNLTVAENVELGLGYPKRFGVLLDRRRLRAKVRDVLERLGAEDINPKALVSTLSVADQRLVMIARGIAADARLLVLDEPSASLANEEIEKLHGVVRGLAETGVAVVYVTHRLDEIFQITDWVSIMRDGKLVLACPTDDLDKASLIAHITGAAEVASEARERAVLGAERGEELLRVEGITSPGVVEDVSFGVRAGELLGIAGLVGSGRTELVRLIVGADRRPEGRIFVRGAEVRIHSPRDSRRHGIVLLPEDRRSQGAVMDFSIRKNITLPVLARFRPARTVPMPQVRRERAMAGDMVSRLGIKTSDIENPVRFLSGGNQQKVVLAKWLESGADVFIFDEPTHGIDVEGKGEVYRLMEELALAGHAVIFISSEFTELAGTCSRVLVIREGRLVGELTGDEITDQALVERCYEDAAA
jgi:ABC-type sugar transport system ATPase subunit